MARRQSSDDAIFDGMLALPSAKQMASITAPVQRALKLEKEIGELEALLDTYKRDLNRLKMEVIPDAMASAGVPEFKTNDGFKIEIKDFVSGSLPKEPTKRLAALKWISSNGGVDLIKSKVAFQLERGDSKAVKKIAAFAKKEGLSMDHAHDIHQATLQAWARERMANGEAVDLDLIGLYAGKVAKFSSVKAKRAKPSAKD